MTEYLAHSSNYRRGDFCVEVGRNVCHGSKFRVSGVDLFVFKPMYSFSHLKFVPGCAATFSNIFQISTTNTPILPFHRLDITSGDSVESANHEIALWFPEGVSEWDSCTSAWVYE